MIEELEDVILTSDLPEHGLARVILAPWCSFIKMEKVMRSNSLRSLEKLLQS